MSDWKERAIKRRDFRSDHGSGPEVPKTPRKKNKRKWCKGKEGIEHKVIKRPWTKYGTRVGWGGKVFMEEVCEVCGKQLKLYRE